MVNYYCWPVDRLLSLRLRPPLVGIRPLIITFARYNSCPSWCSYLCYTFHKLPKTSGVSSVAIMSNKSGIVSGRSLICIKESVWHHKHIQNISVAYVLSSLLETTLCPHSHSPCLQCKNVRIGIVPSWHIPPLLSSWAAGSICMKGQERGEEAEEDRGREESKLELRTGGRQTKGLRKRREVRHKLIWQTALTR